MDECRIYLYMSMATMITSMMLLFTRCQGYAERMSAVFDLENAGVV